MLSAYALCTVIRIYDMIAWTLWSDPSPYSETAKLCILYLSYLYIALVLHLSTAAEQSHTTAPMF